MMIDKILVLGGTGLLGSFAARYLQDTGCRVRIMARNPQKAEEMFDDSYEIVQGDATDPVDILKAMNGCYGVHISLSGTAELIGTRYVAELAGKVDIHHIMYVSGATVAESHRWFPMVANKLEAEKAIKASEIPYTIFCPTWFIEMAYHNFIRDGRAMMLGKHPTPYHWLAADDFGRMVATAYMTETARNKRFYMLGPEAITMQEALERLCARFYPQITSVSTMPLWMAKTMALVTGNSMLLDASKLMGYFMKIGIEAVGSPDEANAILGTPCITLDQWMEAKDTTVARMHI